MVLHPIEILDVAETERGDGMLRSAFHSDKWHEDSACVVYGRPENVQNVQNQ